MTNTVQLDKFDPAKHFRNTFPGLAKKCSHLKYSILALSARHQEKVDEDFSPSVSLSMYQIAIHELLPVMYRRDIEVIASCVILCVLEMLSCTYACPYLGWDHLTMQRFTESLEASSRWLRFFDTSHGNSWRQRRS